METSDDCQFNLSRLTNMLEEALQATTNTKKLLEASCDEAQYLLSNWYLPCVSETPQCTCDENNEYLQLSEVVKNVDQVVEKAQKLRETLNLNCRSKSSSSLQRNTVSSVTTSSNVPCKARSNTDIKKHGDNGGLKNMTSLNSGCSSKQLQTSNGSSTIMKRSFSSHSVSKRIPIDCREPCSDVKRTSASKPLLNVDKKAIRPKFKSPSFQTTYQKDFSVRSKNSGSNSSMKQDNTTSLHSKNTSISDTSRESEKSTRSLYTDRTGISDLDDLLKRVTIYPNNRNVETPHVKTCILHSSSSSSNNNNNNNKKTYRIVELSEAMDTLEVSSDLIKCLKTYHCFMFQNLDGKKCTSGAKRKESAGNFLSKLDSVNNEGWNSVSHEPLIALFSDYITLLSEVVETECSTGDMDIEILSNLQRKSDNLERKFQKWSNIDESVLSSPIKPKQCSKTIEEKDEDSHCSNYWAMIGVWNAKSRTRYRALGEMQYIRYSNEAQWKKFEANMQEIQRLDFQLDMFQVIETQLLPQLSRLNPQGPQFSHIFKVVCSLCNMTQLSSPLLIKS